MSIILNGGSNPSAVTYNGTSLTQVIYNGTTVWESSSSVIPDFPQDIALMTLTDSYGKTTYIRNAHIAGFVMPGSDGKWKANYTCDCTFEVHFEQYDICVAYIQELINSASPMAIPGIISYQGDIVISRMTGIPSGFAFQSLSGLDADVTFYLPMTQAQMDRLADDHDPTGIGYVSRNCAFTISRAWWNDTVRVSGVVSHGNEGYALNYFSGGYVYQGSAMLQLKET